LQSHKISLPSIGRLDKIYTSHGNPSFYISIIYFLIYLMYIFLVPVPMAARSKAYVCGHSSADIMGSNPTVGHGFLSAVSVVCCQVEVFATS